MEAKTHIAVVSIPVFSNQASILALCRRLLQINPHLHITFIIPVLNSLSDASKSLIESLPSFNIHPFVLPAVSLPESTVHLKPQIRLAVSYSMHFIRNALNSLNSTNKLVALVADCLAYDALESAITLNIFSYIYFPFAATVLSLCLHSSWLDKTISDEYKELLEHISIPGCTPIHVRDLPTSPEDRSSKDCENFRQALHLAEGILVNSFKGLEGRAISALQVQIRGRGLMYRRNRSFPSIYPIGPMVQVEGVSTNHADHDSECLWWLDRQESKSVLYVSFGSGGTESQQQMNELALGLELSGQKFLWVVREPNDLPNANYFTGSKGNTLKFLPYGFLERVKGQGMVVPSWAPQVYILGHKATGAFLTHCGWCSTLESVVHGLPIIAWPLFAEQRMIAAMLSDGLNVAVRPKVNENGVVEKDEIATVIKSVMIGDEGRRIRATMKVLHDAAVNALKLGGPSSMTLSQLATEWKNIGG